jgi:hypothetical protein
MEVAQKGRARKMGVMVSSGTRPIRLHAALVRLFPPREPSAPPGPRKARARERTRKRERPKTSPRPSGCPCRKGEEAEAAMTPRDPGPLDHTSPWATEENFWLEGPNFYRAHMTRDAVMSFPPPVGELRGDDIIESLRNTPRWEAVRFSDQQMKVEPGRIVLRYHATARRFGADVYEAECETVYRHDAGGLLLAAHRQVPA